MILSCQQISLAFGTEVILDKIFEIKTLLSGVDKISFYNMVGNDFTRGEIITLFMAMLELLKLQVINITQTEMFGDIEIVKGENFNG